MKKLHVLFIGGTGGNFLRFFLHKFSKLTATFDQDPFNEFGTVYREDEWVDSQFCINEHEQFLDEHPNVENLNVTPIILNDDTSVLYFDMSCMIRSGQPEYDHDNLWRKTKRECLDTERLREVVNDIERAVGSTEVKQFTKKQIRDWKTQKWMLDKQDLYLYRQMKDFENHAWFTKQNTMPFDLECYFDWPMFLSKIKQLDVRFGLQLDFTSIGQMKSLFDRYTEVDNCKRQVLQVKKIIRAIGNKIPYDIPELHVESEAFLMAHLQKNYKGILPSNENFFASTEEIIKQIK